MTLVRRLENVGQTRCDLTALGGARQPLRAKRPSRIFIDGKSSRDLAIQNALPDKHSEPRPPHGIGASGRRRGPFPRQRRQPRRRPRTASLRARRAAGIRCSGCARAAGDVAQAGSVSDQNGVDVPRNRFVWRLRGMTAFLTKRASLHTCKYWRAAVQNPCRFACPTYRFCQDRPVSISTSPTLRNRCTNHTSSSSCSTAPGATQTHVQRRAASETRDGPAPRR